MKEMTEMTALMVAQLPESVRANLTIDQPGHGGRNYVGEVEIKVVVVINGVQYAADDVLNTYRG